MCDSELARELRREEVEAYLAELKRAGRRNGVPTIATPVGAFCKKLLQIFRLPLPGAPAHR
jgi:hypothetical protein